MSNRLWAARDLTAVWHPCSQMKDHERLPMVPIRRAEGVWLEDADGRRYLDAISSWWVNLWGHRHPHIVAALRAQLDELEHVLLAGFTHMPAIELAERLLRLAPPGLTRCFYADNGSAAVEVALKMSFHYWRNRGRPGKTRFITLANSYHGETLGALAVGDVPLYRQTYAPLLMQPITVASPDCYARAAGESCAEYSARRFADMASALEQHAGEVCAVIVEPLVQAAGGMRMYDPVYLELLRDACDRHEVLLIADEIAVGFGRTGRLFACEHAGITPDLLCLSKGLTGGFLPLAAVLATEDIYQAFYAEYTEQRAFLHSHSYTGNPLACRAALASLELFERLDGLARIGALSAALGAAAARFADHPHVGDLRQCGAIVAIELVRDRSTRAPYPWAERRGLAVYEEGLARGVLLRPLGNVVYCMPPYVIDGPQIGLMFDAAWHGIERATRGA